MWRTPWPWLSSRAIQMQSPSQLEEGASVGLCGVVVLHLSATDKQSNANALPLVT